MRKLEIRKQPCLKNWMEGECNEEEQRTQVWMLELELLKMLVPSLIWTIIVGDLEKSFKIMKLKSAFSSFNVGPSNAGGSCTFTWAPSTTGCSSSNGFVSFWKFFLDLKLAVIKDQWWKIVILESFLTDPGSVILDQWSWISDPSQPGSEGRLVQWQGWAGSRWPQWREPPANLLLSHILFSHLPKPGGNWTEISDNCCQVNVITTCHIYKI